eukprot:9470551-Lingulodinium_polyedra.AAC.1
MLEVTATSKAEDRYTGMVLKNQRLDFLTPLHDMAKPLDRADQGMLVHKSEDELSAAQLADHDSAPVRIAIRVLSWTWAAAGDLDTYMVTGVNSADEAINILEVKPTVPRAPRRPRPPLDDLLADLERDIPKRPRQGATMGHQQPGAGPVE